LQNEQAGHLSEDAGLERDVRDSVRGLGISRLELLGISVRHGVVHLTGVAESYAQKWMIERAVSQVVGVQDVRDYLEVRPPQSEQRADAHVALAARSALEWHARVPDGIGVDVTDGVLRLYGSVEKFAEREAAEEAVRNLVGVRDVTNEIRVSHDSAPDVASDVESALRRRFGVLCRNMWVIERDGVVSVSGVVPTLELLGEVDRVVRSVAGVVRVDNRLIVG